jgi:hypothetical protein
MLLGYEVSDRTVTRVVLEEDGQGCVLAFPLTAMWSSIVGIAVPAALGLMKVAGGVAFYLMMADLNRSFGGRLEGLWRVPAMYGAGGLVWLGIAWWSLRSYRLRGGVARRLSLDGAAGTLSQRRERGSRWRTWRVSEIRGVRVRVVRHLTGRPAAVLMTIRVCGRFWPIVARARWRDRTAVIGFAEAIGRVAPVPMRIDPLMGSAGGDRDCWWGRGLRGRLVWVFESSPACVYAGLSGATTGAAARVGVAPRRLSS